MTREEAILKIGELGCYARANGWDDVYTQAVNISTKALEQEPKSAICSYCNRNNTLYGDYCKWCGKKMKGKEA